MYLLKPKNYKRGQAIFIAVIFFLFLSLTITLGVVNPIVRQIQTAHDVLASRQSVLLSEALNDDVVYRLNYHKQTPSSGTVETLTLPTGQSAQVTVTDTGIGKDVTSVGITDSTYRKIKTKLAIGVGASFNYGVQSGNGGIKLDNNAIIYGNIYSNGDVIGDSSGATATGTVVSVGTISDLAVGTANQDTFAWASAISNVNVVGTPGPLKRCPSAASGCNTNYGIPPPKSFPITAQNIQDFKDAASAGGTVNNGTRVDFADGSVVGPKHYTGNVKFLGPTATLQGTLWVEGTIDIANGTTINLDPAYGASGAVIVTDSPADLSNGMRFNGTPGFASSFIMFLSTYNCQNTSSCPDAIYAGNNSGSVILNAQYGILHFKNGSAANEATAWHIHLAPNAAITYKSGLADVNFSSGPSGAWNVSSWKEVTQ
ncbi:hypothetical protein KW783_02840 [Candidatus Parcubacteria bacterium]|nr:hypothetical protein [Candidatus Parcubacteria bacterium]